MKHTLFGATAAVALWAGCVIPQARAQVATIDAAAIAQEVKAYVLETKQYIGEQLSWVTQAQQYATQVQQYATEAEQLAGFIHDPNLGAAMGLLNMAGLSNSLPVSPYAVMNMVNGVNSIGAGGSFNLGQITGILGTLNGLAGTSYANNHVYTPTDGSWASQQLIANGNAIAATQGSAAAAYQDLRTHAAALQALREQMNAAQDPKAVADLQAEVALEQTWTANEAAQLSAIQLVASTQEAARVQRDSEKADQDWEQFYANAKAAGRTF
jgi:hypothetical protein